MAHKILIFFHLVGFAAYLGAGFAQQQLMKKSGESGLAAGLRDEYERLAALVSARIEGPAIGVQLLTGITFLVMVPDWLHMGWLHAKLGCVFLLVGLTHAERANARKIVAARKERGDAAAEEIASRKARHVLMGRIGAALIAAVLALVAYGTA
ncbi:MAG: hypothetical protein ACRENE_05405 [Polyangiaceae bacterium]